MKQKIIIGVIALLVILGGLYVYMQQDSDDSSNNSNQSDNMPQEGDVVGEVPGDPDEDPQTPTSDTIAVSPQVPGNSVTIDNAFLSKPGFISIHEVTETGSAGAVVGTSRYLTIGPKQDLQIDANLTPGGKYIAIVREDNGDRIFNVEQDVAITSNNGPVMTMFSVSQ